VTTTFLDQRGCRVNTVRRAKQAKKRQLGGARQYRKWLKAARVLVRQGVIYA